MRKHTVTGFRCYDGCHAITYILHPNFGSGIYAALCLYCCVKYLNIVIHMFTYKTCCLQSETQTSLFSIKCRSSQEQSLDSNVTDTIHVQTEITLGGQCLSFFSYTIFVQSYFINSVYCLIYNLLHPYHIINTLLVETNVLRLNAKEVYFISTGL